MPSSCGSPATRPTKNPSRRSAASTTIAPSAMLVGILRGVSGFRYSVVLCLEELERAIEGEPEDPGILADRRGRHDVEHVIVRFFGNPIAVLFKQLPEVPLSWICRQTADQP